MNRAKNAFIKDGMEQNFIGIFWNGQINFRELRYNCMYL